jgi:hypothetical protein
MCACCCNSLRRYTGGRTFHPELSSATLTGIVDTVDVARTSLYCPQQLSDSQLLRVPECSFFDWTVGLPSTAVLVGGMRPPNQTCDDVMQLLPLPSGWAWLPLPSLPSFGVHSHAACSLNGCVVVWGGRVAANHANYFQDAQFGSRVRGQDMLLFDVHRGKEWVRVKLKGQPPPHTYGACMLPIGNNQILVFGGTDGGLRCSTTSEVTASLEYRSACHVQRVARNSPCRVVRAGL